MDKIVSWIHQHPEVPVGISALSVAAAYALTGHSRAQARALQIYRPIADVLAKKFSAVHPTLLSLASSHYRVYASGHPSIRHVSAEIRLRSRADAAAAVINYIIPTEDRLEVEVTLSKSAAYVPHALLLARTSAYPDFIANNEDVIDLQTSQPASVIGVDASAYCLNADTQEVISAYAPLAPLLKTLGGALKTLAVTPSRTDVATSDRELPLVRLTVTIGAGADVEQTAAQATEAAVAAAELAAGLTLNQNATQRLAKARAAALAVYTIRAKNAADEAARKAKEAELDRIEREDGPEAAKLREQIAREKKSQMRAKTIVVK